MRKKRAWLVMMAMTAAVLVLAACGVDKEGQPGPDEEVPESYPPANLIITSGSGWTEEAFWERFEPIKEKFPHHTFEYIRSVEGSRYVDLVTTGQDIDIFWDSVAVFPTTLQHGLGMDMTELIRKHNVDLSLVEQSMLNTMRSFSGTGVLQGLPVLTNTLALYYNIDIFNELGVDLPAPGMNWDEVNELNRRLTRSVGEKRYVGISYMFNHYWDVNPISILYVENDKATINNGKFNPLFQTILNSAAAPGYREVIGSINRIPNRNDFTGGLAAMFAGLANSHLTVAPQYAEINWDVTRYPVYKESPNPYPQAYPTYFSVSATSKFKDQSMEVIKYLVSEEFQLSVAKTGAIPVVFTPNVLNSFSTDLPYHNEKNLSSLLYPNFAPGAVTSMDSVVRGIYYRNLLAYAKGEMDLNTLLRTAEEEANLAIEAFKAQ